MEVVSVMKKALVVLAIPLALALAVSVADAGRISGGPDGDFQPFDARELAPARDTAAMAGIEREGGYRSLVVGAAVPGIEAAVCRARLHGRDGSVLEQVELSVDGGSTAQFDFASRIGSRVPVAAEVSCDKAFYPYSAAAGVKEPKLVWGESVGPSGPCDFSTTALEVTPGQFITGQEGTIHTAKQGKTKGIVCMMMPKDLKVAKLVMEWDVSTGPWHSKTPHANHGMNWLHRGRFRSGTIANVNAFGPKKSIVKMNQNVDMARGTNTNTKAGYAMVPNNTYHLRYTYDAANRVITSEVFLSGVLQKKLEMKGTAQNKTLSVPKFGFTSKGSLFAEFGHYPGQHFPEVVSLGWRYSNLRVELITVK
jgi:hypothetical protein